MTILLGISAALIFVLGYFLYAEKKELARIKVVLDHESHEKNKKIEELTELKKNIAVDATKDHLTGLPSRKVFDDRFTQLLHQSQRFNLLFAILFIDIDKFRMLNAALGFIACNQILKEVATRLNANIRKLDTVCRFSNDEFVVLISLAKPEMTAYVADRLKNTLAEPFYINHKEIYLTASFGIAVFPTDGDNENTLLIHAEQALQQAKLEGSNHIQFYRKEAYEKNLREMTLISNLHSAAIYNNFEIYYQLQMNVETNKIYSVEALLYWKHPEFGLMEFNDFMQFAESSGNIIMIGEWFIRHACEEFKKCKAIFETATLTLTISRRQLENPHFTYKLSQVLQEMQIEPQYIVLEISEKSIFRQRNIIDKTLAMLKNLGVNIGISQFGIGNISWWEFKTFSIHSLKISPIIIKNMLTNNENTAMMEVMLALAKTLEVNVIADGVTHETEVNILKKMGCGIMQGDFIQKPLLLSEFIQSFERKVLENT